MANRPEASFKRAFVDLLGKRLKEPEPFIQVILGPRQVGKTTGVKMLPKSLGPVHYVTADDTLGESAEWITAQWQDAKLLGPSTVLILDEVQKVLHWSEKIKALWDAQKGRKDALRVVLLGSSSLGLQRGLDDSLTGRFEILPVRHWSYHESHAHFGLSLEEHLLYGGYPAAARFVGKPDRWQAYLKGSIIETVIGRDILRQASVRKPALFRRTFELLAALPAQEISYNKLLGQLQESGNVELVKHYIELFEGAFLFRSLQKYSGSIVRKKASSPKILPLSPALCVRRPEGTGSLGAGDAEERGRLFEAAVGAELAAVPGNLSYWRDNGTDEVDFVLERGRDLIAIEVKSGRRKSARGMAAFLKQYPKAKPLFITWANFAAFSKGPEQFIEAAVGEG